MEGDSDEDNQQEETANLNLKQSLNLNDLDARRASEQYREQRDTHMQSAEPIRSSIDTSIKRGVTVGMV